MLTRFLSAFLFAKVAAFSITSPAHSEPLRLYIDADYSISREAAAAIELGVRTALDEANWSLGGLPVELEPRDHRANSKRSFKTLKTFLQDQQALAVIGGMHSPPYLTYKDFINENEILMLLPWSAAGPITRSSDETSNWIYRLSVDDSKAGKFLIDQAVVENQCNDVALLLIDTGWGRANLKAMTAALGGYDKKPAYTNLFPTIIGKDTSVAIAEEVAASRAKCVIMLAHAATGADLTNALHERVEDLRIFSHWSILGRDYPQNVAHEVRNDVRLRVLQTCGLKVEQSGRDVLNTALARAGGDLQTLADVPAPTGFVHGYDLVQILIAAAQQASKTPEWSGTIAQKRAAVKTALEALQTPVEGILRTYVEPFETYRTARPDAHEALGADDLCMAEFRPDGRLQDVSRIE